MPPLQIPDAVAIGFQFLFGKGRDSSVEFGDYSRFVVGEGTVFRHRRISLSPDRTEGVSISIICRETGTQFHVPATYCVVFVDEVVIDKTVVSDAERKTFHIDSHTGLTIKSVISIQIHKTEEASERTVHVGIYLFLGRDITFQIDADWNIV